jgi:ComF family protein
MNRPKPRPALSSARPLLSALKQRMADVRELVFPRYCAVCGRRLTPEEETVCIRCLADLPFTGFRGRKGNAVERLFFPNAVVKRANALVFYQLRSEVRKPVLQLKYFGHAEVGIMLGRLMASDLDGTGFFDDVDAIVPVPLSARRQRKRGYNQSEMLSRGIAEVTHVPVWTDVVKRTVDNATQTHLTFEQRIDNVAHIFCCTAPDKVRDKHLLLVDDIVTTGSTLKSCMEAFAPAGGVTFSILTLGYTASAQSVPDDIVTHFEP